MAFTKTAMSFNVMTVKMARWVLKAQQVNKGKMVKMALMVKTATTA